MQYAESLLLCGQIIDAEKADFNTYEDLLCVCPYSKKKVRLEEPYVGEIGSKGRISLGKYWMLVQDDSIDLLRKCQRANRYTEDEIDTINNQAQQKRLELFRPHLWELIKSSAVFIEPVTFENYDNFLANQLALWFVVQFNTIVRNPAYQEKVKEECKTIYESCVRKTLANEKSHLFDKARSIFADNNYIIYGLQIAGEVLEFVLQTWQGEDILKLIYLTLSPEMYEKFQAFSYNMSKLAIELLNPGDAVALLNLLPQDKYLGMNKIEDNTKNIPLLEQEFRSGLVDIDTMFSISLVLIFASIPWIEELKKINTHAPTP